MLALLIFSFMILLFAGVPVAFSMAISSIIYILVDLLNGGSLLLSTAMQRMVVGIDSFPLMAIPFFVMAGEFMNQGGITKKLLNLANSLVGHIRGGMAQVNILASVFFAAMSGSSIACAQVFGRMLIPGMVKDGYDRGFASAVISTSATIGPIIPPSIIMIVYGVMANVSVGKLLLAGVLPGILMGVSLMTAAYIVATIRKYPVYPKMGWKERLIASKNAFLPMLMPLILIGGILTGYFTPTEAAVIAVVYGFILALAQKEITLKDLPKVGLNTTLGSARIMFIISAAALFGWLMTLEQAPQLVAGFLMEAAGNPLLCLLMINVFLLILGMFMESTAIIIMVTPMLMPVVAMLGFDPIWFGIMMLINVMVGCVTIPVGVLMFVTNDIAGIGMGEYVKHVWPFYIALFGALFIIIFFPAISLWLPNLLMP